MNGSYYPHGSVSVVAGVVAIIALAVNYMAFGSCFFVKVTNTTSLTAEDNNYIGFGVYYVEDLSRTENHSDSYCLPYTDEEKDLFFDAAWRTAAVFGWMAYIIGFTCTTTIICTACCPFPNSMLRVLAVSLFLCGVLNCLMMVGLASKICKEYDCTFSHGAGLYLLSSFMWMVCAVLMAKLPPPRPPPLKLASIELQIQQQQQASSSPPPTSPSEFQADQTKQCRESRNFIFPNVAAKTHARTGSNVTAETDLAPSPLTIISSYEWDLHVV